MCRPTNQPAAVLSNNVVEVCNASARSDGVRRGQRRRDAQARCPELVLLAGQSGARRPLLRAGIGHGRGAAPWGGADPAGVAGGAGARDATSAASRMQPLLSPSTWSDAGVWDCRLGVADDLFTAEQAARQAMVQDCVVVPPGTSATFLRMLPVQVLAEHRQQRGRGPRAGRPAPPTGTDDVRRLHPALGVGSEQPVRQLRGERLAAGTRVGRRPRSGLGHRRRSLRARSASSRRWSRRRRSASACAPPPSGSCGGWQSGSWSRSGSASRRRSTVS